jgi:hypothetical protein
MKKFKLMVTGFLVVLLSTMLNATTIYEDGSSPTNWVIYDNNPSGATLTSVNDSSLGSVIEFSGAGINNGYRLGNNFGRDGAWNNTKEFTLSWNMKFSSSYVIYVRVQTESGYRYLYYTNSNKNRGKKDRYLHHGLGKSDGWQEIVRDLQADLQDYEPYNKITSVNAFLVRGDGQIDDIKSFVTPAKSWTNYDAYELYEDAQNGDYAGWKIYDNEPSGATVSNIFDEDKNSKVIELKGDNYRNGIRNGYRLGNYFGNDGAWNNQDMFNISWSMKFDGEYYIFVSVQTDLGHRYLYYTKDSGNLGNIYPGYIHHGLGEQSGWRVITRDLQADLHEFESDNNITSVNAFLVRGNGRVDDIFLFSDKQEDIEIPENIDITIADSSVVEGDAGISNLNFDVILSENSLEESIALDYNITSGTADSSDYNYTSSVLNIGRGETKGTITVYVKGDKEVEGNETITVAVTPRDTNIFNQKYVVATGTIINDDHPNVAPVANDQNVTLDEDTNTTITLAGSDAEDSNLTFIIVANPVNGTLSGVAPNLIYTPNADFAGNDSFTFVANDGELNSTVATVNITVTDVAEVNNAPEAASQNITLDEDTNTTITLAGSDAEGSDLTFVIVSDPENGTLSGTLPDLVYTPKADFAGNDSFAFVANDGELNSTVATVNITVNNINDIPTVEDKNITIDATTSTEIILTANDPDNDTLTYKIISVTPDNANLALDGATVRYIPEPPPAIFIEGPVSFRYQVNDGTADSNIATVTLNFGNAENGNGNGNENSTKRNFSIASVNDATISENSPYTITPTLSGDEPIGNVSYTLSGDDADDFTIDATSHQVSMQAKDYENPEDANGDNIYNITVTATDTEGNSASKSWSVTITDEEEGSVVDSIAPIADYRFDECIWNGNNGEVIDQTGNYNATSHGVTLTNGKMNNGALFDSADYIELPTINGGFTSGITIMAWVDFGDFANYERIVELSNGLQNSNVDKYISFHTEQGKLRFQSKVGGINAAAGPIVALPSSGMHHYVATYDHSTGVAKIFIDNELKETANWDKSKFDPNAVRDHNYIGRTVWGDQYEFKGKMDEVKIVNRPLSSEEINIIFNNENGGKNYNGTVREAVDCNN